MRDVFYTFPYCQFIISCQHVQLHSSSYHPNRVHTCCLKKSLKSKYPVKKKYKAHLPCLSWKVTGYFLLISILTFSIRTKQNNKTYICKTRFTISVIKVNYRKILSRCIKIEKLKISKCNSSYFKKNAKNSKGRTKILTLITFNFETSFPHALIKNCLLKNCNETIYYRNFSTNTKNLFRPLSAKQQNTFSLETPHQKFA